MSRSTVRAAIVSYLENAGITSLSTVKPFPAKFTPEMEFYAGEDPGTQEGAIIYTFVSRESEKRIALGGSHSGKKAVEYEFVLDCFFRSTKRKTEDVGADNETFLDSLISAIRADRQAGAPTVIFQWGEGILPGGSDIEVTSYYPRLLNGAGSTTQVFSSVRVAVVEILTA
jgi:hypothetical protein